MFHGQRVDHTYYDFQDTVGRVLLAWGGLNTAIGAASQVCPDPVVKQFGVQSLAWGAINAAIGMFGLRGAQRARAEQREPGSHARRFRTIVLVNAVLDAGYIAGGLALLRRSRSRPQQVGAGLGVLVQGSFLMAFDLALAALCRRWARG